MAILLALWGLSAIADRLWFLADRSVPGWDQADYLSASLTYLQGLQQPQWGSGTWWTEFWQLRSKIPPLTYISAALVQMLAGTGPDAAAIVLSLFTGVLLISVFAIGAILFGPQVGSWAAVLCLLLPGFYRFRLDFLLDYPLTAMVTVSFAALTWWRSTDRSLRHNLSLTSNRSLPSEGSLPTEGELRVKTLLHLIGEWLSAIGFGLLLGLAFLTKQPALFFLALPITWLALAALIRRSGGRLLQLLLACGLSVLVWGPWYRANWFLMLTAGKRATIDSAAIEGDPALNTWAAWTFYLEQLPRFVSWPLLVLPIAGLVFYGGWRLLQGRGLQLGSQTRWLAVFLVGGYLLSSVNVNKDARYMLPLLPTIAVVLAVGLVAWGQRGWGQRIRWGTAVAGFLLMAFNLVPLGIQPETGLGLPHYPYLGPEWPHAELVQAILDEEPYLQANVGVLPSTGTINQHNVGYFGALQNKQVFARQVGIRESFLKRDGRSLTWFLTKIGDPGSVPSTHAQMKRIVEEGGDFQLFDSWELPQSEGTLKLYRQKTPPLVVEERAGENGDRVQLTSVVVPKSAPPGHPLPVTYQWVGPGTDLQEGVVLLSWEWESAVDPDLAPSISAPVVPQDDASTPLNPPETTAKTTRWIHDRGIGAGTLRTADLPEGHFSVADSTAMLPPVDGLPGIYSLNATYINRTTGDSYPLAVPANARLEISPTAPTIPAPELDLVTQLRNLAPLLRRGEFDPVFAEIGRINQYDPVQDYLEQTAIALDSRLAEDPKNLNWLYALAIARVQQQNAPAALDALEKAAELDPENPFAHGFVAFVHLYQWHPNRAQPSIDRAIALNPNLEEIQILDGVAALMRGNLVKAWRMANRFL